MTALIHEQARRPVFEWEWSVAAGCYVQTEKSKRAVSEWLSLPAPAQPREPETSYVCPKCLELVVPFPPKIAQPQDEAGLVEAVALAIYRKVAISPGFADDVAKAAISAHDEWLRQHSPQAPVGDEIEHLTAIAVCAEAQSEKDRVSRITAEAALREAEDKLAKALAVVHAACSYVAADVHVHPILSREEAVRVGAADLIDAVNKWQGQQPAARQSAKGGKDG